MGCGASKDGAGGVTGDKPNKNSDPMVISLWRKRPRGRPVCQVAKRLIQAEVALRLHDLALAGRGRANWP